MGDVVDLKPVKLEENFEFVSDCCRFQEGILTQQNMKLKYRSFTNDVWEKLGDNDALFAAVEEEKIRRVRSGRQKRERAQVLVTAAPDIMSKIMLDDGQSARHRIDSAKALDDFASKGPEAAAAAAADRFQITIVLNGDVERYDKSIAISADDIAPNGNAVPQRPVVIADKAWDDDEDVVSAPVNKPVKVVEHETNKPKKSPQEIALEAMMKY